MGFSHQQSQRKMRRSSAKSEEFDSSDGEEIPESVIGPIEIPKAPSHPEVSSRRGSTPGMKAPTHIDFSAGSHSPRNSQGSNSAPQPHFMQQRFGRQGAAADSRWPPHLYRQWFGAITEGRYIQVHSILADYPDILDMRRREPTPFHMALTHIASQWLGNDTTGMDGLQVAIMGYKNAYANWRVGNGAQSEQMTGMSADQMKEHVSVREVILGVLIDAITPEQLITHLFGRQQNTTLHLAAFYNDSNLVERLLRQGAAVDIPNRMGFLPADITNDKPTLQWLVMYQGQVRGAHYQSQPSPPQEPQHFYNADSSDVGGSYADMEAAGGPAHSADDGAYHQRDGRVSVIESELAVENIGPYSDDGQVSESSYIKQFADSVRDIQTMPNASAEYEMQKGFGNDAKFAETAQYDNQEEDGFADNVSVASSSDRQSLGLGGDKAAGDVKVTREAALVHQRVLNSKSLQLDDRRDPASSTDSETAYRRSESPPESPGAVSYHTATGAASDDGCAERQDQQNEDTGTYPNIDTTLRIKVDPRSIDDDDIDDIFSDTDDYVQMEPSYCQSDSGLSGSSRQQQMSQRPESFGKRVSPTLPPSSSSSSKPASLVMPSLSGAMAQPLSQCGASVAAESSAEKVTAANAAISAFPVMIQSSPMPQPIQQLTSKKSPAISSIKQKETVAKDPAQQQNMTRPASPFLLRDSLYEMIMGRSSSRTSLTSGYSSNSNTVSNSSTVAVSREHPTLDDVQQQVPTSPTSMSSQLSPQSTSFEDPNAASAENTLSNAIGGPTAVAATVEKPQPPHVPETVAEECIAITPAESPSDDLPSVPTTGASSGLNFETAESDISSASDSEAGAAHVNEDAGFDTRASSPIAQPRPTAASLFSFMQPDPVEEPEPSAESKHFDGSADVAQASLIDLSSSLASASPAAFVQDEFPPLAEPTEKPARIGRRQGRATAGLLQDDEGSGFLSHSSSFSFVVPKHDGVSSEDKHPSESGAKTPTDAVDFAGVTEPESPALSSSDMPSLPANVPLTRDKRDQYLQTLINRNTMRGSTANGSPKGKRTAHAAISQAMRAASPARSFSSSNDTGSGDDGDAEHDHRANARGRASRHISMRSEGAIDPASLRPPSAHSNREALAVSGASINGRIRANTMSNSAASPTMAAKPVTPTRKVSPSLATLKTRNLVSNSPAKLSSPSASEHSPLVDANPNRVFALSSIGSSRVRAMSTPAEARAPSLAASPSNTARIGRVAALSQNFERQQASLGPPPKIAIPGRATPFVGLPNQAGEKSSLSAASAPLGGMKMDFSKPVARSSSISSSHSTGAHGQATTASSAQMAAGSSQGDSQQQPGHQEQQEQQSQEQNLPLSDSEDGHASDHEGHGGNRRNDGGGNGSGGDDGSSPSLSVSVLDPTSTDSNGSTTTSHTGSSASHSRGLAANVHHREVTFDSDLLDSRASADQLGSSIFSSVEAASSSSKDPIGEPSSGLHAPVSSRRESEADRKSRFKELASRRKSGTLERISNRGLVKSRKALIDSSGASMMRSESPQRSLEVASSSSSKLKAKPKTKTSRVHFAEADVPGDYAESSARSRPSTEQLAVEKTHNSESYPEQKQEQKLESESFFRQQGEGRSLRDLGAINERVQSPSSYSNPEAGLEELQQASSAAFHPESRLRDSAYVASSSVGRSGINTDDLLKITAEIEAQELMSSDVADPMVSRTSSSGKSKSGSGSGEDSIHILSSLDTLSTPGSTPLDSMQENTHMGLLAQYNINQKRMDKRYKRESAESEQSFLSSGQESQPAGLESDVDLGFSTISDINSQSIAVHDPAGAASTGSADESGDGFNTMLPVRQRYDSRALFGLSTVVEEDEESRNPSMVIGDPSSGSFSTQRSFRAGAHARSQSSSFDALPASSTMAAAAAAAAAASVASAASEVNTSANISAGASADASIGHSSTSTSSDAPGSEGHPSGEMQERRSANTPLRGLRSAILQDQHLQQQQQQSIVREPIEESAGSPEPVGLTQDDFESAVPGAGWSTPQADDDTHSHAPSYGSHSFDPNIVFGYTSEENNSTMASRSSFDRSDFFTQNRPGSAASRILYMHPIDQPASEADAGYAGDSESRQQAYPSSPLATGGHSVGGSSRRYPTADSMSSLRSDGDYGFGHNASSSAEFPGAVKGKMPARTMPEMQQKPPRPAQTPEHVLTVEEIEEDLSTDEEPIPAILFVESQDFEGYVPIGYLIQQEREERRRERRLEKEAAKKGLPPPEPPKEPKVISPLWFIENNYVDPLPPDLLKMMIAERDKIEVENMSENRVTENPDKKRILESASISSIRLRQELDDFIAEDSDESIVKRTAGSGTIKPLTKRPRVSNISAMFEPPTSPVPISPPAAEANAYGTRKSFLDSIEIPVSDIESDDSSDDSVGGDGANVRFGHFHDDEAFVSPISQEFQVPGHELYREPIIAPSASTQRPTQLFGQQQQQQAPRKRLVLRAKAKTFSEQVLEEVNGLDMHVRTDNQGTVTSFSAGQFAYEPPAGTVRPSMIPQYVSQLNGVPAGPFFMPPKATAKAGYLYMRILGIEDIEDKTDSIYFVIRNGIDTLATTPVNVGGQSGTTINQEFRILTDPNVSITMWMRFRSDAIIYKGGLAGAMSGWGKGDARCAPPLLRKLVRRNTRSRNKTRWNCSSASDSVFDFDNAQGNAAPGARRDRGAANRAFGLASRPQPLRQQQQQLRNQRLQGGEYPERVSSAFMTQTQPQTGAGFAGDGDQHMNSGFNDPRSLNATQAPSSVFYEPGTESMGPPASNKGLAQAKFKEETRGVAVVHVGEMIEEVFLRGLVDSWDVENVWESRKGARLQLQLFYIPECPLFREEELPKTLSDCEMAMEVCNFHNRTLNSGYMSQRGGDTRFWRRRYFRLIGGFLFAYHEDSKEPRCFIDLNDATRVVDHRTENARRQMPTSPMIGGFGNADLVRSTQVRRRMTHKRNNSDHSSRDGVPAPAAAGGAGERSGTRHYVSGHGYASDSEPVDMVDIVDPVLQQSSMRRRQGRQPTSARTEDSGIVSVLHARDSTLDSGMQHSFSIEFGEGGSIEFYTDTEAEKRVWVEIIKRIIGSIPKIPSWLIKLLHADVSERIDTDSALASGSSLATTASTPSSKFQELAHPLAGHY